MGTTEIQNSRYFNITSVEEINLTDVKVFDIYLDIQDPFLEIITNKWVTEVTISPSEEELSECWARLMIYGLHGYKIVESVGGDNVTLVAYNPMRMEKAETQEACYPTLGV